MKKELIQLAQEKGFERDDIFKLIYPCRDEQYRLLENESYYLWLCLLQKWLRDNKKALVEIFLIDDWDYWGYNIHLEDLMSPFFKVDTDHQEFDKDYKSLEKGCLEALKLI